MRDNPCICAVWRGSPSLSFHRLLLRAKEALRYGRVVADPAHCRSPALARRQDRRVLRHHSRTSPPTRVCPQRLDRSAGRRRAPQTRRSRRSPPLVARRQAHLLRLHAGGVSQIWSMNPDGSGASQVTHLSTEADGEIVSPDGKYLASHQQRLSRMRRRRRLQSETQLEAEKQNKVKARAHHRPALSPLDHMAGQYAAAICSPFRSRTARSPTSRPAIAMCRRSRSAARTITPFRPTARKSASR